MYKKLVLIILSFFLIFLLLFPGCQPATTPDLTGGTISGQAALPGSSSKDITGYTPIPGATVTVIDSEGNTHTTHTDFNGFYSFGNISVKANTIIYITKDTEGGGKIVFMEVIPKTLSPEENFYAGIADAESTALALVIETLINLGQLQKEIDLEEIISAPGFASLEEAVRQAQENNQDILILSSIITQAQAIADYIVNPPSPTPAPTPVPSSAKEITAYKFETSNNVLSSDVAGTIDSTHHTVSLTVPYGTDVTSLIATFTLSQGATAKVGDISQVSGTTSNDFTSSVTYTVTAEDNSTQEWIVTITIDQPVRYVATDGDNSNDGSEAYPWHTIQYALDNIPFSGMIMVKEGIYDENINFPSDKAVKLKSVSGVYFTTILGNNGTTVTCNIPPDGTTLEGFTITHKGGYIGKGIYLDKGSLFINKCVISHNSADYGSGINNNAGTIKINYTTVSFNSSDYGGGIYNKGTLTITDSTIFNNDSSEHGGGIYNKGALTITGSHISNNAVELGGGGIWNEGTLTITGSHISNNAVEFSKGGGIFNDYASKLTINESTISGNFAGSSGGGIYNNSSTSTITASTVSNNSAGSYGGGIFNDNPGELTISESIICNNYAATWGGGILNGSGGILTIIGSDILENIVSSAGGGAGIFTEHEIYATIGGNDAIDLENFNHFVDNYKEGSAPSADQHIHKYDLNVGSIDCHADYPYNNFTPGP